MSFYEDYVADGLCCASCGVFLDSGEPGFVRYCGACLDDEDEGIILSVKSKPWPCSECDKRFGSKHARAQHYGAVHAKAKGLDHG